MHSVLKPDFMYLGLILYTAMGIVICSMYILKINFRKYIYPDLQKKATKPL